MSYVDSIKVAAITSTGHHWEHGKSWYLVAHREAVRISRAYNVTLPKVCGIISALSPSVGWEVNLRQAEQFVASNGTSTVSTYGAQRTKALNILRGSRMGKVSIRKILRGPKTVAFFNNILMPKTAGSVTIDRHMLGLLGYEHGLTPKRYRELETDFRQVAELAGTLPHQLQAVLWLAQRENQL